jgi:acyl-CoA synthetase (AMP-forming)/AMP-acid ligase II
MHGLMMQQPLLDASLLSHAERHHGEQEIVSRRVEGDIHRYRYRDLAQRARRMANALAGLGVKPGERVGTLAWNGYRHMELYFAVSGSGSVLHTLNPRLHVDQLAYIIEHGEDRVVFFDLTFLPLIENVAPRVKSPKDEVQVEQRCGTGDVRRRRLCAIVGHALRRTRHWTAVSKHFGGIVPATRAQPGTRLSTQGRRHLRQLLGLEGK